MRVFALYEPKYIGLIGPWMRSWEDGGFDPRLLLPSERGQSRRAAVLAKGGGIVATLLVFNRSLKRKSLRLAKGEVLRATRKQPGLVFFPAGTTREDVSHNGFI
jgi:hypothetical protein